MYHPKRIGSQEVSTCSREKSRCHCQWPRSLPQPYNFTHIQRGKFGPKLVSVGRPILTVAEATPWAGDLGLPK